MKILISVATVLSLLHQHTGDIIFSDSVNTRRRQFRLSEPIRTGHSDQPLSVQQTYQPRGCDHSSATFCTQADDYPNIENILKILNTSDDDLLKLLYHNPTQQEERDESEQSPDVYSRLRPTEIISEQSESTIDSEVRSSWNQIDLLEEDMCQEVTEYIFPTSAITKSNGWRFVINVPGAGDQSFVQAVRVRRCLYEGDSCRAALCEGSKTVCK